MKPNKSKTHKKTWVAPKISKLGKLSELSQTKSKSGNADGGASPNNKMNCLTPPPAIEEHRILVSDFSCQNYFKEIIQKIVKPGDVVLDLGTGSGIHALFAAQAGAKKVYAVDCDHVIEFAKNTFSRSGYSNQIFCVKSDFSTLQLPEQVDVIISNLGFLTSLTEINQLKKRFLKPGGIAIPDGLGLNFSLYSDPKFYSEKIEFWKTMPFGFNLGSMAELATNHPQYLKLEEACLLSAVHRTPTISLDHANEHLLWNFPLIAERTAVIHGIGGWYEFKSQDQTYLDLAPPLKLDHAIWTNFMLPLESPMSVVQGETLQIEVAVHLDDSKLPIWTWSVQSHSDKQIQSSFKALSFL